MTPKWCSSVGQESFNLSVEMIRHPWLILSYLAISSDSKLNLTVYNEACINVKLCLDGHEVEKINV